MARAPAEPLNAPGLAGALASCRSETLTFKMTASSSAGWLPRSTSAPRSRASRSSRSAVALAALRNIPSVVGPSCCRTASSSCGRERQEDGCLAEELPCKSGGQSAAPHLAPCWG